MRGWMSVKGYSPAFRNAFYMDTKVRSVQPERLTVYNPLPVVFTNDSAWLPGRKILIATINEATHQ
jgi:hypothetical protein